MFDWLSGKKTYFCAAVVGLVGALRFLKALGLPSLQSLSDDVLNSILLIFGAGGAASLRSAVEK